jgi:hypothetical protein
MTTCEVFCEEMNGCNLSIDFPAGLSEDESVFFMNCLPYEDERSCRLENLR